MYIEEWVPASERVCLCLCVCERERERERGRDEPGDSFTKETLSIFFGTFVNIEKRKKKETQLALKWLHVLGKMSSMSMKRGSWNI